MVLYKFTGIYGARYMGSISRQLLECIKGQILVTLYKGTVENINSSLWKHLINITLVPNNNSQIHTGWNLNFLNSYVHFYWLLLNWSLVTTINLNCAGKNIFCMPQSCLGHRIGWIQYSVINSFNNTFRYFTSECSLRNLTAIWLIFVILRYIYADRILLRSYFSHSITVDYSACVIIYVRNAETHLWTNCLRSQFV